MDGKVGHKPHIQFSRAKSRKWDDLNRDQGAGRLFLFLPNTEDRQTDFLSSNFCPPCCYHSATISSNNKGQYQGTGRKVSHIIPYVFLRGIVL